MDSPRSDIPHTQTDAYERGQRLYCSQCQSEIEVISPCSLDPPAQDFRCCGRPMQPSTGVAVNLNVTTGEE